jgi:hypothetical protein
MHLFEIQSSKHKSFSFLKWQKLGIRSRDVFICQLMVTDNLFSQQTKFWWMFFLNKRCQKPTQKNSDL